MDKMELIVNKFDEICDRDDLHWWELVDSVKFNEVDDYADSLNLTPQERKEYIEWCDQLYGDL